MLVIALSGLAVNMAGALLLHGHAHGNLNMKGAYLHVLGDLLGSVGAIGAGRRHPPHRVDPGGPHRVRGHRALILYSAWSWCAKPRRCSWKRRPAHIDVSEVVEELRGIDGLDQVHDVHVWTLTSGFVALSGHGVIDSPAEHMRVLEEIQARMKTPRA